MGVDTREQSELGDVMELFYTLNVVVVTQLYAFIKTHRTLRRVGFTEFE